MQTGISYLNKRDWIEAHISSRAMHSPSQLSALPFYALIPPDPEDGTFIYLRGRTSKAKLYLIQKDNAWERFPLRKVRYQPFSRLSFLTLPLFFSFPKPNFFEQFPNYILSTQWKKNGKEISSITLRPKKERVYFYLDAGELGRVKIEKMTAESKVRGKPSVLFEYPIASVEPPPPPEDYIYDRQRMWLEGTPYYFQRISVDGVPCEPMSWEEIKSIAKKVEEKVFALVIFQGWKGTELLFQSLNPTLTEEKEVFVEGNNGWGDGNRQIKLQIVQSAYDFHPFLQAYFQESGKWWVAEQICVTPSVNLGTSALESLKKIKEMWEKKEIFILIDGGEKAPSLLIEAVGNKKIFFPDGDPASERRYLPQEESLFPRIFQEVELASNSLEAVSYSKNSPKYASAKKKKAPHGEDLDLGNLTLHDKVVSLLTGQELEEIS